MHAGFHSLHGAMTDPLPPLSEETVPLRAWMLPTASRASLLALHAFARGIDDMADDPLVKDTVKREALQTLRQNLEAVTIIGGDVRRLPHWAQPFGKLVQHGRASLSLACDLLMTLEEDTRHVPIRDYESLLTYAQGAAVPIGRLALQLAHGEDAPKPSLHPLDALCVALQLLNVVRDCGRDWLVLQRIYLPADWMRQSGVANTELERAHSTPALRAVLDHVLERASALLDAARPLPALLPERRFRLLMRVMLLQARALHRELKIRDPLQGRIRLPKRVQWECVWRALMEEWLTRRRVAAVPSMPDGPA